LYSLAIGTRLPHVAACTHDLIDQKELLAKDRSDVQELPLDNIVVPDSGLGSWERLTGKCVHTEGLLVLVVSLLNLDESILGIEATVLSENAGHDKKRVTEASNTELGLSRNFLSAGVLGEMLASGDLKGTGAGNDGLVLNGVLNSTETIADGILGLSDRVVVRALDQDGAREGVLDAFNESVLVVTERLLVDKLGEAEVRLLNVIDGVELLATASERDTLTVSALGTADADDVVAGEDLERGRVNTLLVDDNEVFVSTVTEALLELNNLHDAVISELTLGLDELLPLVSIAPEESGVDLGLLVLEGDVEAHDVAVLEARGEVALSATVIEDEATDEARLRRHLMLHVHDLDHVEVDSLVAGDALDGIDDDLTERVGDGGVDLGVERALGHSEEGVAGHLGLFDLELLEEAKSLSLSLFDTINDDSGMDALTEVALSLAHELSNEEHIGRGAIADDIILGSGSAADHGSSRVLNLHLVEEDATVLGQLDLTGTTDEHLKGALGTEVGLKHFLEALGGVDVDAEGGGLAHNIGLSVNELERGH